MLKQLMKRMLPMLLAVSMLVGSAPVSVLAAGKSPADEIEKILDSSEQSFESSFTSEEATNEEATTEETATESVAEESENILEESGSVYTLNVTFPAGENYKVYSSRECSVGTEVAFDSKIPLSLEASKGDSVQKYYVKAAEGYTISRISSDFAAANRMYSKYFTISTKSVATDYTIYEISISAKSAKIQVPECNVSITAKVLEINENVQFNVNIEENVSAEILKGRGYRENFVTCNNGDDTYSTANTTLVHVYAKANSDAYMPKVYLKGSEDEEETEQDYELIYSDETGEDIDPFYVPAGVDADSYQPEIGYDLGRFTVSGNTVRVASAPVHTLNVTTQANTSLHIFTPDEMFEDSSFPSGYEFDSVEDEEFRSRITKKVFNDEKIYFVVRTFGQESDEDSDIEEQSTSDAVVRLNGVVLSPIQGKNIYMLDATDLDSEILVEGAPAGIPVQFNPEAVKNFTVVNADVSAEYPRYNEERECVEYVDSTKATFSFEIEEGMTFVNVKGVYWRDSEDRGSGTFEKIIKCDLNDGIYSFESVVPKPSVEFELEEFPRRLEKIIIVAGKTATIQFHDNLEIEPYKYYEEDGDYYLDEDSDPATVGHTQTHIIGEPFYVGVEAPSDEFKLAAKNEAGKITELKCVDSWGRKEVGFTKIYEINPAESVFIDDEKNIAGNPKKVTFDASALGTLTLDVPENANFKKDGNSYVVNKDGTVSFKLSKKSGRYSPKVSMTFYSDTKNIFPSAINTDENGGREYVFNIGYRELNAATSIVLNETLEEKTVTFEYKKIGINNISVQAGAGEFAQDLAPSEVTEKEGIVTAKYVSDYGELISYSIESAEKYQVGSVTTTQGTNAPISRRVNTNKLFDNFYAAYDTKVQISPFGIISTKLEVKAGADTWNEIEPDAGVDGKNANFSIVQGSEYRLWYYSGEELLGPGALNAKLKTTVGLTFDINSNPAVIKIDNSADIRRVRTISATIAGDGTKYSLKFTASANPSNPELASKLYSDGFHAGVDVQNALKFRFGNSTMKSLALYGMEISYEEKAPGVKYSEEDVSIELNNRKGVIIIPKDQGDATPLGKKVASVSFYRKDRVPTDSDYKAIISGLKGSGSYDSIPIVVTEPKGLTDYKVVLKKDKPASDDTTMTFDIKSTYDDFYTVKNPVDGAQYYEIKVVPKAASGKVMPAEIEEKTFYIPRDYEAGDAWFTKQDEEIEAMHADEMENESASETDSDTSLDDEVEDSGPNYKDFIESYRVKVSDFADYMGQAWDYDVTLSIVQTRDKNVELESYCAGDLDVTAKAEKTAAQINFRSKPLKLEVSTYEPKYETNLGVTKKASKVYTGQYNAQLATLKFSADTVCKDATVYDITDCSEDEKLEVYVDNGAVYATASKNTALGNHIIEIVPAGPEGMFQNSKSIQVSVVQGIETIEITGLATEIYKASRKAASATASVKLNKDTKAAASKAINWKLVSAIDYEEDGQLIYTELTDNNLSIKNGKITVKKDYSDFEQVFYVLAMAADYDGNPAYALSDPMKVSDTPKEIAEIKLLSYDEAGDVYTVIGGDGSSFTTNQLENAYAVAFAKKSGEDDLGDESLVNQDNFSSAELRILAMKNSEYTMKSAKAKALAVESAEIGYKLSALAAADNVTLTAQTTDGGKKKNTAKISVKYAEPAALKLKASVSENVISNDTNSWNFTGTINTPVTLKLQQKDTESSAWTDVKALTSHTLKLRGGKIIASDKKVGEYTIVVTADKATVTFKDVKNNDTQTYTIVNDGYSAVAAPKVRVQNTIAAGVVPRRKVDIKLTTPSYDTAGKSVLVEVDAVKAAVVKTADAYKALEKACAEMNKIQAAAQTITLNFDDTDLAAGKYKVTLTIGKGTKESFVADCKPISATITVAKPKARKGSYVVSKTLVADTQAPDEFTITGTGKLVRTVSINAVYGANIRGKANEFTKYFEVKRIPVAGSTNGDEIVKICLKSTLTDAEKAYIKSTAGANDRICFVSYTYIHGDDGKGGEFITTKTTKTVIKY